MSGRLGWLLYGASIRVPGLWLLSGYARHGLNPDDLCDSCLARWRDGDWFWRWCFGCRPGERR